MAKIMEIIEKETRGKSYLIRRFYEIISKI